MKKLSSRGVFREGFWGSKHPLFWEKFFNLLGFLKPSPPILPVHTNKIQPEAGLDV